MYFITATGTNIGKTFVTCALTHQLLALGKTVCALKPVISGYDIADANTDTALLLAAQNLPATQANIDAISPWRFAAPLAPNVAARLEGKTIDFEAVLEFCKRPRAADLTLVEGAGGVMSPLTDHHTMLGLASALGAPAILVVGDYLGTISHTLSAVEVLRARGIALQAIVVSQQAGNNNIVEELRRFLPDISRIGLLPRVAAGEKLWQNAADLMWMVQ